LEKVGNAGCAFPPALVRLGVARQHVKVKEKEKEKETASSRGWPDEIPWRRASPASLCMIGLDWICSRHGSDTELKHPLQLLVVPRAFHLALLGQPAVVCIAF
jgi:hypothetical protein